MPYISRNSARRSIFLFTRFISCLNSLQLSQDAGSNVHTCYLKLILSSVGNSLPLSRYHLPRYSFATIPAILHLFIGNLRNQRNADSHGNSRCLLGVYLVFITILGYNQLLRYTS